MQLDPRHVATLAAILETGSFEAAARDLGLTQGAVSQRLKALEDRVGTILVRRGSPCTGTETGRRIAAHANHVGLLEAQLARDIAALSPGGPARVRVAVNADSLATWFLPALSGIEGILFDVVVDDQEFSADWLRRGEVAAAVTALPRAVAGCDIRPLGTLRYHATASPDYVARWFPDGVTAPAIHAAPALRYDEKDELQARWIRTVTGKSVAPGNHGLPSSQGFVTACLLGMGWGMNPAPLVADHLTQGTLVELVPGVTLDVPLFWQSTRLLRDVLDPLGRAVRRAARRGLAIPD
ncbi:LysR family transcriptional regulator ArgP [Shimia biformata]|uniref:LysR family transcriptional regulator ArgP n=1 Tax=Shimia biformata TaxID=1294299 RepID=UPI00194F5BB1|nr:LysR family transcriptional regulator ArgP [Shimia biformata]